MMLFIKSMLGPDQVTKNNIRIMFSQLVIVPHFLYHMNVIFLAFLSKLGLQDHEKVITLLSLQRD